MDLLFQHLTTEIIDEVSRKRFYEPERSKRLHWIKYHIDENKTDKMLIFSALDPDGVRTYIYDEVEEYVIVLEPYRNGQEYYLLSAYYLSGRNKKKIKNKYKRKLQNLL